MDSIQLKYNLKTQIKRATRTGLSPIVALKLFNGTITMFYNIYLLLFNQNTFFYGIKLM